MTYDLGAWFGSKIKTEIATPRTSQRILIIDVIAGDVVVKRLDAKSKSIDRVPLRVLRDVVARVHAGERVPTSSVINGKAGPVAALLHDLPSIQVDGRPQAARLRPGWDELTQRESAAESSEPLPAGWEGEATLITHYRRERDPGVRRQKFAGVIAANGTLACEVCSFDFANRYGELGLGFAECHHHRPLADGARETQLADLAVVCANCHRMIHRASPPLALDVVRRALG